eukprot:04925.XXX_165360_166169_1 [CDS] Oithona nana genome sequencing.
MEVQYISRPSKEGFIVIGAGLPRTGTNSLRIALSHLLNGPVHHMYYCIENGQEQNPFWDKALDGKIDSNGLREAFENWGLRASVDYPSSYFYKELIAAFPNAKVLLSIRDPESWYTSVKNTIWAGHQLGKRFPLSLFYYLNSEASARWHMIDKLTIHKSDGRKGLFDTISAGKEESVKLYEEWIDEVKTTVPPENLLIFHVKEGWKPLCQFLDLPEPSIPFPRSNDAEAMQKMFEKRVRQAYFAVFCVPVLASIFAYAGYKAVKHFQIV